MIENKTPPRPLGHATPTIGPELYKKAPRCPDHRVHKPSNKPLTAPTIGHL